MSFLPLLAQAAAPAVAAPSDPTSVIVSTIVGFVGMALTAVLTVALHRLSVWVTGHAGSPPAAVPVVSQAPMSPAAK